MEERKSVSMDAFMEDFANVYYIKLLLKEPVEIRREEIKNRLLERFTHMDVIMEEQGMYSYALCDHNVTYKDDARVPSQLLITQPIEFDRTVLSDMVLQQCWNCEDVEGLLENCHYEIMFSDFMAGGLPLRERCEILASFADLMMDVYPEAEALYWPHAGKLVPRAAWENSGWNDPALHFLDGGVNVRLFNIMDSADKVVDTTGLTALGLCDLQCHFHDLDVNFVVRYMFNFAFYLYTSGEDVIKDGDTMDGSSAQERWSCQHEDALIPPKRVVIDVNPGKYASGKRSD